MIILSFSGPEVAEEIVFNEVTTGAHNDFEKATKIARSMVTEYGMSSLGPVQLEHQESSVFLGRDYNKSKNFSDAVALEIDQEVRKIISEQYEVTKKIISENMDLQIGYCRTCETVNYEKMYQAAKKMLTK